MLGNWGWIFEQHAVYWLLHVVVQLPSMGYINPTFIIHMLSYLSLYYSMVVAAYTYIILYVVYLCMSSNAWYCRLCTHVFISLVHSVLIVNSWLPSNNRLPVSTIARTTSGTSVLMVYVQYSTSSHNLQIYRIWYNSILIMRELTMVGGFVMKCVPTLD